ncbi:hypothetical protein YIM73052_07840 [Thermus antranikianii]
MPGQPGMAKGQVENADFPFKCFGPGFPFLEEAVYNPCPFAEEPRHKGSIRLARAVYLVHPAPGVLGLVARGFRRGNASRGVGGSKGGDPSGTRTPGGWKECGIRGKVPSGKGWKRHPRYGDKGYTWMMGNTEDAELLRQVILGNEEALLALYRRHASYVHALARRILRDKDEAKNVVQETFLRIWNKAEYFDPELETPRTGREWPRWS